MVQSIQRIGVVGAGTMGSGIALAALLAGFTVVLVEVSPEISQRAREYIEEHLNRKQRANSLEQLNLTGELDNLAGCQVVIEAIPEELALKQRLFKRLDDLCPPPALLATNTSTLPVTAIAAASSSPERVAGMHFFNPAPVLPLVEVVRGARTSETTLQTLVGLAEQMGKTPVIAGDTPGFIVNRVARPFYGEALRLLGEGAATVEQIDHIVRSGGGFRMGPFELMDLIGIDVNFAATQSIYEQTFYEPRYRPHGIQARMVAQGAYGRKSGRGFYQYGSKAVEQAAAHHQTAPLEPPERKFVVIMPGSWAPGITGLCQAAGYEILAARQAKIRVSGQIELGLVSAGRAEGLQEQVQALDQELLAEIPLLVQCADVTLAEAAGWVERQRRLVGFDGLFLAGGKVATLAAGSKLEEGIKKRVEAFFARLGRAAVWVQDTPALVLPRIVATLANEAAFTVGEGVAEPETIDRAMQLGTNYPHGPLAWAQLIGYAQLIAVLEHLQREYGEERYRLAPWLRRQQRWESPPQPVIPDRMMIQSPD